MNGLRKLRPQGKRLSLPLDVNAPPKLRSFAGFFTSTAKRYAPLLGLVVSQIEEHNANMYYVAYRLTVRHAGGLE